jgi:hypothetical protein
MGFAITEQLSWPVHRREQSILVLQPPRFEIENLKIPSDRRYQPGG